MTLAEALLYRSELQQKLENLQSRLKNNIKVQENEKPREDPEVLIHEYEKANEQLADIVKIINKKNNETKLADGRTVAEALVDREKLIKLRQVLVNTAAIAEKRDYRLTHTEIKMCVAGVLKKFKKKLMNYRKSLGS